MTYIFIFAICLLATTAGAVSGIGGGVIIKPVMDAVSGLNVSTISFLSGCTVLAMAAVSLIRSRNTEVKIEIKKTTLLAIGASAGGILGKYLFDFIRGSFPGDRVVGSVQSFLLILITFGVFLYVRYKYRIQPRNVQNLTACIFIGLILGMISAFIGIGGGPINIAVLSYFFSMDSKTCALNSIYTILFSQATSLISTFYNHTIPDFDPLLLALMVVGGILGGFVGSAVSKKLTNRMVDKLFSMIMLVIIGISLYNFIEFFYDGRTG